MTSITIQEEPEPDSVVISWWTNSSLLKLSVVMLTIGSLWRILDVFILGLGDTWLNILPSKLFPLAILVLVFFRYRREELGKILGLSRDKLRTHAAFGVVVGVSMYVFIDAGAVIIYGAFFDPSYPRYFQVRFIELLWYQFIFFFINAVFEESLFRGLLQNGLRTRFTVMQAILLSAAVFSIWHIVWPIVNGISDGFGASQAVAMLLFGLVFGAFQGVYYERFSGRSSLVGPIAAHTLVNFFNESLKIGPEITIQGPDVVFASPVIMGIMAVLFMATMLVLFAITWRFRIENVEAVWSRFLHRIRGLNLSRGIYRIRGSRGGQ
ncbi:MAG: CPBP family intramembrane glutamic endopeptidase [Candidatus Thorarchaeota archaeon]